MFDKTKDYTLEQLSFLKNIHKLLLDWTASALADKSDCIAAHISLLVTSLIVLSHPITLNVNF